MGMNETIRTMISSGSCKKGFSLVAGESGACICSVIHILRREVARNHFASQLWSRETPVHRIWGLNKYQHVRKDGSRWLSNRIDMAGWTWKMSFQSAVTGEKTQSRLNCFLSIRVDSNLPSRAPYAFKPLSCSSCLGHFISCHCPSSQCQ